MVFSVQIGLLIPNTLRGILHLKKSQRPMQNTSDKSSAPSSRAMAHLLSSGKPSGHSVSAVHECAVTSLPPWQSPEFVPVAAE